MPTRSTFGSTVASATASTRSAAIASATSSATGPQAFGAGGGDELVTLGGISDARNQSLAYGIDEALSSSLLADFRFGWFKYRVNVLPSDFGTTPATDAGIPGLNLDDTFASGLPAFFIGGDNDSRRMGFGSGLSDRVGRCNCPLDEDEQQFQVVGNLTKMTGDHTIKLGVDVRRAYNLRVPSDRHRSGELNFENERTQGPAGGGLALASFMLGDVTRFTATSARPQRRANGSGDTSTTRRMCGGRRRRSRSTTGCASTSSSRRRSTNRATAGSSVSATGQVNVAGVGDIGLNGNVENTLNWAPRLGATYQFTEKTVLRAGYGRSYDIGVFGSLFGHSVTQNLPVLSVQELNAPQQLRRACSTSRRVAPDPVFPPVPANGQFALPNGVFARALPDKQRPPHVDAFNVMVQHQLTDTICGRSRICRQPRRQRVRRRRPGHQREPGDPDRLPERADRLAAAVLRRQRAEHVRIWRRVRLDAGDRLLLQLRHQCVRLAADRSSPSVSRAATRCSASYTLQRAIQDNPDYFFFDSEMNRGPADWDRTHNFTLSVVAELPIRPRAALPGRTSHRSWTPSSVAGRRTPTRSSTVACHSSVTYRDAGADRDTGGNNRPNLVGDPDGPKTREQVVQRDADRLVRQRLLASGPRHVRDDGPQRAARTGLLARRCVALQALPLRRRATARGAHRGCEPVQQRQPWNPDSEVGVPGNPNPNAGRINGNAFGGSDPMRNFQFALKFIF